MADWYRRKTWTKTDEEEYFTKLGRARKDGRAQYLRIQALELAGTKLENLLIVAETLLNKILTEYPDNKFEKSQTLNQLGNIYKFREEYSKAIEYFQKSLDFELEYPQVTTSSYLDFSETVIKAQKIELYEDVYKLLTQKMNEKTLKFPYQNYLMYSILSIISEFKNDTENAKKYSDLAEINATTETNTLWNPHKKHIGIVKERKTWLDKLVKQK